ncbi:MAG: LysR family transcriptional regulator [Oligoflexales bacterium]
MPLELKNLNLDSLVQFHYVARLQSLAKAAKHLGVSGPAITHSLKKLEDSLGVVLCKRGKAGFQLTEYGRSLFEKTQVVVSELDGFLRNLDQPQNYDGVFSVGMIDNLDNQNAQKIIDTVTSRFPKIKLNVVIANSDEITAGILSEELDLGFGIFHLRREALVYKRVGQSTMRYFISNRHPLWKKKNVTKQDVTGMNVAWIDSKKRNSAELASEVFIPHPGYKMKVAAHSNHLDGALAILKSGFAIVPIPPSYIGKLVHQTNIRELKLDTKAPVFAEEAVYNPNRWQAPPVALAIEILRKMKE